MAWYLNHLLKNRITILSRHRSDDSLGDSFSNAPHALHTISIEDYPDVKSSRFKNLEDDDEYNDLIVVEKKIKELHEAGIISNNEMSMLNYVEDGKPIVNSKKGFGKNRLSLARDFGNLCNKIAFYVGGIFTDDGYADYMKTKYSLTDEQVDKMIDYMKSKYKNKLMRKQKKTNDN